MEVQLELQMNEIMSQSGVTGVLCSDKQGLALAAHGSLKPELAGLAAGLANKALALKHGIGADDVPVVSVELDTGNILIRAHGTSTLAVHKV